MSGEEVTLLIGTSPSAAGTRLRVISGFTRMLDGLAISKV
jgi:hypothetical protein